jgi:hypothetical protein
MTKIDGLDSMMSKVLETVCPPKKSDDKISSLPVDNDVSVKI